METTNSSRKALERGRCFWLPHPYFGRIWKSRSAMKLSLDSAKCRQPQPGLQSSKISPSNPEVLSLLYGAHFPIQTDVYGLTGNL
jgi:hypothetical protein